MRKRGTLDSRLAQAAMEFLLTYGWAILVVLVVIGALVNFNVLDPTALLPDKCVLQAGPLTCADNVVYFFPSRNKVQFQMKLQNLFSNAVQITDINISGSGFECKQSYPVPKTISSGSGACISILCEHPFAKQRKKSGFKMQITYFSTPGIDKTISGEIYSALSDVTGGEQYWNITGCLIQATGDGNGDGVLDNTDKELTIILLSVLTNETILDPLAYDLDCTGSVGGPDLDEINSILTGHNFGYPGSKLDIARQLRENNCRNQGVDPDWRP